MRHHGTPSRRGRCPAPAACAQGGAAAALRWRNVGAASLAMAAVHGLVWLLAPGVIWLVR